VQRTPLCPTINQPQYSGAAGTVGGSAMPGSRQPQMAVHREPLLLRPLLPAICPVQQAP